MVVSCDLHCDKVEVFRIHSASSPLRTQYETCLFLAIPSPVSDIMQWVREHSLCSLGPHASTGRTRIYYSKLYILGCNSDSCQTNFTTFCNVYYRMPNTCIIGYSSVFQSDSLVTNVTQSPPLQLSI